MNTVAPEVVFVLAEPGKERVFIIMRGTFRWEMEYEALTGASYHQAVLDLDSQLTEYRNANREKRAPACSPTWARCSFDLFYASIAQWRNDSGWNRDHARAADEGKPERERRPYLDMAEALGKKGAEEMQSALIRLLYAYNFDPSPAAEEKGKARRPKAKAKRPTSTTK
jgi:hypothetical protein